jgi:two-component system sensor histidine kinase ChvG
VDKQRRDRPHGGLPWFLRSLALRLVVLVIIFVTVPVLIYQQFRAADLEKQELLLQSAQLQGELIARSLVRLLEEAEGGIPADLSDNLSRLVEGGARVKVLLRPAGVERAYGFFYVAAVPAVTADALEFERQFLIEQGILGRLGMTCSGDMPLALRLPMDEAGREQLLTSITPVNTDFGCWAIIISQASEAYLGSSIGRPYWNTPEVRVAAMIYLASAVMILALFLGVWRNLSQFGRLARQIGFNEGHGSFAAQNKVPELHSVASDFDRLVDTLRRSAEDIRRAAEDNAHAFKTPIGIIRQSIEPLRRMSPRDDRGQQSVELIEQAVSRLDMLVSCARQVDETTADLYEPPDSELDLADLLERTVGGYASTTRQRRLRFKLDLRARPKVLASEDQMVTVIENVIDNAVRFSPDGAVIDISLQRHGKYALVSIGDRGPGVAPENLEAIFERYFSEDRDQAKTAGDGDGRGGSGDGEGHFGIGLWIVRRNVESLGGKAGAENREGGGLIIRLALPPSA